MDDPIGRQLLLQVILIAVNAFFAAAEIAVVSLNANKLRKMAEEGDKHAARMLELVGNPTGFLSAIQIGITLAGFLGSAFAADNFADRLVRWIVDDLHYTAIPESVLNTLSVILITIILSFFTLVFGELVPKRIAMQKPMVIAKFTTPVVRGVSVLMKPVIWLLSASTNGVLRLIGFKNTTEEEAVTEEGIRMMVDIGEETGTIDSREREMIDNIFEFDNLTARDVMTRSADVETIGLDDSQEEIIALIRETGLSRFPVYENEPEDIIGILNAKEYFANRLESDPKPLKDILRPAYFVPESVPCNTLFFNMQKTKNHIAMVVDEYGDNVGIVTMEDLLEEIVGNIYDELDPQQETEIVQLDDNLWKVSGSCEIEMIEEQLDIELPDDVEFDTLGGLVFSQLTVIPEDGSLIELDAYGLHIKVESLEDHRVEWAQVSKNPEEAPEDTEKNEKDKDKLEKLNKSDKIQE